VLLPDTQIQYATEEDWMEHTKEKRHWFFRDHAAAVSLGPQA